MRNRLYPMLILYKFQIFIYKSGKYVKFVASNQHWAFMSYKYQTLLLSICLYLAACNTNAPQSSQSSIDANSTVKIRTKRENSTTGKIYIAVDDTYRPIIDSEISTFMAKYQDAEIHPIYLPGEEAIAALLASDTIRLAITMRKLNASERAILKGQNASAKMHRLATDAVTLIVHKDNKDTIVSQENIKKILSGEITSWKQLNPESPLDKIKIVFDNAQSSTVQFLQDSILAMDSLKLTTKNVFDGKTNEEVIRYIIKDKNALGIIGIAWISDMDDRQMALFRQDSINVLKLEYLEPCSFQDRFFQPYQAYIHQRCYPYTRGVYAVLRESFFGLGTGFVSYITSDPGQRIIHKAGLVPELGMKRIVRLPSKREQRKAEESDE